MIIVSFNPFNVSLINLITHSSVFSSPKQKLNTPISQYRHNLKTYI